MIYYHFLRRYVAPFSWQVLAVFLLLLLISVCSLATPYLLKEIIDTAFPSRDKALLMQILGLLLSIYIVKIGITFLADYLQAFLGNSIIRNIRAEIFDHLVKASDSYFKENKTGELVHKISAEVDRVEDVLTNGMTRYITNVLTVVGLVVMLCVLNYKLFFFSVLVFPLVILNTVWFAPVLQRYFRAASRKEAVISHFFTERVDNIKMIKLFNAAAYENKKLRGLLDELVKLNLKRTKRLSLNRNISMFLISLGPLIVFGAGGMQIMMGQATLGALVAFLQYLNRLYSPSTDLIQFHNDLVKARVSMQQIIEMLSAPKDDDTSSGADLVSRKPEQIKSISFHNVSFHYHQHIVLRNVSFRFAAGCKYALVGPSGTGKTTVVNLICRLLTATNGRICINEEKDCTTIDLVAWRNEVCLVPQEALMYQDTMRENIRYGSFDKNDDEIMSALKVVGFDGFVAGLENGLDTQIESGSSGLSSGQIQRIALARAVLRNPQILILDESTSALDTESECFILKNLFDIFKDSIIIIISHRLTSIVDVDEILYLSDGDLVSAGTHGTLVSNKHIYRSLFRV